MIGKATSTAALLLLGMTQFSFGQEAPTSGIVYDTIDKSSITFECSAPVGIKMDCKFNQTAVRPKAKPDELSQKLDVARAEFKKANGKVTDVDACHAIHAAVQYLDGKMSLDDAIVAAKIAPERRGQFHEGTVTMRREPESLDALRATDQLCKDPSEEHYLELARLNFQKDTRTCYVSSNAFTQSFQYAPNPEGKGAWVVNDGSFGICGVINISRFEIGGEGYGMSFWNYISRKVVSNPEGDFMGKKCGAVLDTTEHPFVWNSPGEQRLQCTFIEFSVL
jgi:hypothetical protein